MTLYTLVNEKGKADREINFDLLDRSAVLDEICTVDVSGKEASLAFVSMQEAQELAGILNKNTEDAYFSPRLVSSQCEENYKIDLSSGRLTRFQDAIKNMLAPKPFLYRAYPYAIGVVIGATAVGLLEYIGVFDKIMEFFK